MPVEALMWLCRRWKSGRLAVAVNGCLRRRGHCSLMETGMGVALSRRNKWEARDGR